MNRTNVIAIIAAVVFAGFIAVTVIAIFGIVGFGIHADSQYHKKVQDGLSELTVHEIKKVTILLWLCEGDTPVELPKEHYPRLIHELKRLEHTNDIGFQGPWQIHRAIIIEAEGFPAERIFLTKRPETKMLADVYSNHKSAYFDGSNLWTWLISIPEIRDQKPPQKKNPC